MTENSNRNWFAEDAATFGDRLAAGRDAQNMTQVDLARRLGVALATVEGWENDLREPRANRLQMLSGVLDVSLSWLLTGEGQGVDPEADVVVTDLGDLLREIRVLQTEMQQSAAKLGVLEKRLKKAVSEAA